MSDDVLMIFWRLRRCKLNKNVVKLFIFYTDAIKKSIIIIITNLRLFL